MNEISRCCRVLGVRHGASEEEVKKAYRDLVQVWHPDRFPANERLQSKAQEQLKEINRAYEFLLANAFHEGALVDSGESGLVATPTPEPETSADEPAVETVAESEPSPDWPEEEAEMARVPEPRNTPWALFAVLFALLAAGGIYYASTHRNTKAASPATPVSAANPAPKISPPKSNLAVTPIPRPVPATSNAPAPPANNPYPYATNVLASMTDTNGGDWLRTKFWLSPPFVIKARVYLTNLDQISIGYGLGGIQFNCASGPKELRVSDPGTAARIGVPGSGLLLPDQAHELRYEVTADRMTISADGTVRQEVKGSYAGVKGLLGIHPFPSPFQVENFTIETPQPLREPAATGYDHGPIAGDLLPFMVLDDHVQMTTEPDGIGLQHGGGPGNRLMTTNSFHPPFIIRTRAKTDSVNLRIYCGGNPVILNWEMNPTELRVHDPLTGEQTGVGDKGAITPNEWHAVIWEIQKTGMRVAVDGQVRFQNRRDYRTLETPAGIGPGASKITVDYFVVEQK